MHHIEKNDMLFRKPLQLAFQQGVFHFCTIKIRKVMTLLVFPILKQKQNKRKTRGFLKSQFAHFREKNKMF